MTSGVDALSGSAATGTAAACANLLLDPMTNVSNVYFGLSLVWVGRATPFGGMPEFPGRPVPLLRPEPPVRLPPPDSPFGWARSAIPSACWPLSVRFRGYLTDSRTRPAP